MLVRGRGLRSGCREDGPALFFSRMAHDTLLSSYRDNGASKLYDCYTHCITVHVVCGFEYLDFGRRLQRSSTTTYRRADIHVILSPVSRPPHSLLVPGHGTYRTEACTNLICAADESIMRVHTVTRYSILYWYKGSGCLIQV
jgi:hypothetical protein